MISEIIKKIIILCNECGVKEKCQEYKIKCTQIIQLKLQLRKYLKRRNKNE